MLDKKKIHLYRMIIYAVIILGIAVTGYQTYQRWLNPLGMKPEANPKQHDGSQEFNGPVEWKSVIEPAPDEDGVRRFLDPWELHQHGKESEPEPKEKVDQKELPIVPKLGIDN